MCPALMNRLILCLIFLLESNCGNLNALEKKNTCIDIVFIPQETMS